MTSKFQWETTEDGSPTLRDIKSPQTESMHNIRGAYGETQFIYGTTIRSLPKDHLLNLLSVGLGLGYNEVLMAYERFGPANLQMDHMTSYEIETELTERFLNELSGPQGSDAQSIFSVFAKDERYEGISQKQVQDFLVSMLKSSNFRIESDFLQYKPPVVESKFNVILYDAFSAKTSGPLWEQNFLTKMLEDLSSEDCLFSTYAATGNLNRALKATGFTVEKRLGYKGKRECTFAHRGNLRFAYSHP